MIKKRRATVTKILHSRPGMTEIEVLLESNETGKAINYDFLTGSVKENDQVILNTTAVSLGLGTGGRHFVIQIEGETQSELSGAGHIMKLRYTPMQMKCLAVEEEASEHHAKMANFESLGGLPVVVGTLHSMLPAIIAGIRKVAGERLRIAYVMTDGAALPCAFSNIVFQLKEKQLITHTITCGNAFGGDIEAINIYTGLIAAKEVAKADIVVVAMGPGIVGTGTTYGFTGVEQGEIINAVNILEGQAIAVPRISFADKRDRHYGVSHHTLTSLDKIALSPASVVLPVLPQKEKNLIDAQINKTNIKDKHKLIEIDSTDALLELQRMGIPVTTMGRRVEQDKEFFLAACAAGIYAARMIRN